MTEKEIHEMLVALEKPKVFRIESIENGAHNIGFPDAVYFRGVGIGTIEYKIVPPNGEIPYRTGQFGKLKKLKACNTRVFLLCFWEKPNLKRPYILTNQIVHNINELTNGFTFDIIDSDILRYL